MIPIDSLIFCAGYGTRMRPYSEKMPKSLLPLSDGESVLFKICKRLKDSGLKDSIVNYSWGRELFEKEVERIRKDLKYTIVLSPEPMPLGHGGALVQASPLFKHEKILGLNGDTITDFRKQDIVNSINLCTERSPLIVWVTRVNEGGNLTVHTVSGTMVGTSDRFPSISEEYDNDFYGVGVYMFDSAVSSYIKNSGFCSLWDEGGLSDCIHENGKTVLPYVVEKLTQISVGTREEYELLLNRHHGD